MPKPLRPVAWASSAAAPVLLVGGWVWAAAGRPGFDSMVNTLSALAARDAPGRGRMTAALCGLGVCHLLTAWGLRPAALPGRWVLGVGGAATFLVAAFPLAGGADVAHFASASVAFGCLALWPALASDRGAASPWVLRPRTSVVATAVLVGLVGWLVVALRTGDHLGLAERTAATAQALWPLVVVAATVLDGRAPRERCPKVGRVP